MSQALLAAAHGSHLNPDSSTPAFDHADRIRATGVFDEIQEAFWKEEPHFREALRTLASEGYFTEQVIPRELRLEGWDPALWDSDGTSADHATLRTSDVDAIVRYCGPVGTHDAMSDVIVRLRTGSWDPLRRCLADPRMALLDQSEIFEDGDVGTLTRLGSHLLLTAGLVAVLATVDRSLAVAAGVVLAVHIVSDAVWDLWRWRWAG